SERSLAVTIRSPQPQRVNAVEHRRRVERSKRSIDSWAIACRYLSPDLIRGAIVGVQAVFQRPASIADRTGHDRGRGQFSAVVRTRDFNRWQWNVVDDCDADVVAGVELSIACGKAQNVGASRAELCAGYRNVGICKGDRARPTQ